MARKQGIRLINMKAKISVIAILGVSVIVSLQGCGQRQEPLKESGSRIPALAVNKNAPLLLDEPGQPQKVLNQVEAKNNSCYVCHANYEKEPLAQWHAKANYACSDCHGESIAHKNDENPLTPPDRVYSTGEIDNACGECHFTHDVQPLEVVRRWKEYINDTKTDKLCEKCHDSHNVPPADVVRKWQKQNGQKIYEKPIVCTDCHGDHRLKTRSVRY